MTQPAGPVFFLRSSGQGGLRSGDIVGLEGTQMLGFLLIGRRPDRQFVHAVALTRESPSTILGDLPQWRGSKPGDRAGSDEDHRGILVGRLFFGGRHGRHEPEEERSRRTAKVIVTTEATARCRFPLRTTLVVSIAEVRLIGGNVF